MDGSWLRTYVEWCHAFLVRSQQASVLLINILEQTLGCGPVVSTNAQFLKGFPVSEKE